MIDDVRAATFRSLVVGQFICDPCREQDHQHCPGHGQCDCQHRPPGPVEPVTGPPGE